MLRTNALQRRSPVIFKRFFTMSGLMTHALVKKKELIGQGRRVPVDTHHGTHGCVQNTRAVQGVRQSILCLCHSRVAAYRAMHLPKGWNRHVQQVVQSKPTSLTCTPRLALEHPNQLSTAESGMAAPAVCVFEAVTVAICVPGLLPSDQTRVQGDRRG